MEQTLRKWAASGRSASGFRTQESCHSAIDLIAAVRSACLASKRLIIANVRTLLKAITQSTTDRVSPGSADGNQLAAWCISPIGKKL